MFLGIEIGGTKLQLGLGAGDGNLVSLWRGEVDADQGGEGIRRQIAIAVPQLLKRAGMERSALKGIGVGFGGPVDDATKTIITSHHIDGWNDFPLADWLSEHFSLPVVLGNDCDCAGLAEAHFGAGKGLSPIFYITIGSGIGGGLIIDGEIYRGCGRGAAEIGHLSLPPGNTLESVASGWGIAALAQAAILEGHGKKSIILDLAEQHVDKVTAANVADAAAKGDKFSRDILQFAWRALACNIIHVITLLCPRRIVIGGGVSLMGEQLLFEPLRALVVERVFAPFAGCYDIVPAALGEEVVVHGALALARRSLKDEDL